MSDTTNQVLSWKDGEGNFIPHVNSFNLFGTSVRQNPCGVMDGAPTEDTVGVVGALIVDVSTDSRKKDMWKCIAVTERPLEEGEDGYDPAEPEKTKSVYKWNKVGSSSTEIVETTVENPTGQPENPDEDVDYIVNDNGVYLFYKWIKISDTEYQWTLIAGSVSEVVESKEVLDTMTGNTYTDYYVPKTGTIQVEDPESPGTMIEQTIVKSYFHYRWTGNNFAMIGADSYSTEETLSKDEVEAKFTATNKNVADNAAAIAGLQNITDVLVPASAKHTTDIADLKTKIKNYTIQYGSLPSGTTGELPPAAETLTDKLFLLSKKEDGSFHSESFTVVTGGGGNTSNVFGDIYCPQYSYSILKGTKELNVRIRAYIKQGLDAPEEAPATYAWKNMKGEIISQGNFNNSLELPFNLVDLGLTDKETTVSDDFEFHIYDAKGIKRAERPFRITQVIFSANIISPLNNFIYSLEDDEKFYLKYSSYGQNMERTITSYLDGMPFETISISETEKTDPYIVNGSEPVLISALGAGAHVLSCQAQTSKYVDAEGNPVKTEIDSRLIFVKDKNTKVFFGSTYDYNKNGNVSYKIEQYDLFKIPYYLSDSDNNNPTVTLAIKTNAGTVKKTQNLSQIENFWNYTTEEIGEQELTITYGTQSIVIRLLVTKKDLGFTPKNNLLAFDFNPRLIEIGTTSWEDELYPQYKGTDKSIRLIPSDNFDWVNGGFKKDKVTGDTYFKICSGTTATITYSNLFGVGAISTETDFSNKSPNERFFSVAKEGVNFKAIFKTENVSSQDSPFLRCTENKEQQVKLLVGLQENLGETQWVISEEEKEKPTYTIQSADGKIIETSVVTVTKHETNEVINNVTCIRTDDEEDVEVDGEILKKEIQTYYFKETNFSIIFEKLDGKTSVYLSEIRENEMGLILTTTEAIFSHVADAGQHFTTPCSEEEITEFNFNIPPAKEGMNSNIMTFYEDGVPSLCQSYLTINSFNQIEKSNIVIGSPDCDVLIYRLKAYQEGFSSREVLNDFILDARTPEEMGERHNRNDCIHSAGNEEDYYILPKSATYSDVESLAQQYHNLRFILIEAPHVTEGKDSIYKVPSRIECIYRDGRPEDNWRTEDGIHVGQGTTSNTYGFSGRNINIYLNPNGSGIEVKNALEVYEKQNTVTLTKNSMPTDTFNIKVNVASSEHSNNALLQKLYDENLPYEPRSRVYHKLISDNTIIAKTTMEFVNCVVFIKETSDTVNKQRVYTDNNYHFYSLGNLGDAKVTDEIRLYGETYCTDGDVNGEPVKIWKQDLDPNEFVLEIEDNHEPNATFQTGKILTGDKETLDKFAASGGTSGEYFVGLPYYPVTPEEFNQSAAKDSRDYDWGASFSFRYVYNENDDSTQVTKWNDFYDFVITSSKKDFEDRLKDWFIEEAAIYFYLFTERFSMMDNRAKNTFWHWSKWYITEEEATLKHNWNKATAVPVENAFGEPIYKTEDGYIVDDIMASEEKNNGYRFDFWDYDNDSSIGINNMGVPTLPVAIEDIDKDYRGNYHFNAAGSVFFRRIRDYLEYRTKNVEEGKTTLALEEGPKKAQTIAKLIPRSEDTIILFDKHQRDFPEEFWRQDFERKYLRTFFNSDYDNHNTAIGTATVKYVDMYTGRKKYQRKYWETEQNKYFNSKYLLTSDDDALSFRYNDRFTPPKDAKEVYIPGITIIPYSTMYASLSNGNSDPRRSQRLQKNIPYQFDGILQGGANETNIRVYFLSNIKSVSGLAPYGVNSTLEFKQPRKLSEAILGDSNLTTVAKYKNQSNEMADYDLENNRHTGFSTITTTDLKLLKKLNIENYPEITSMDLSNCMQLRDFEAQKSNLTSVIFPENYLLENVELPRTLQTFEILNQPNLFDKQNNLDENGFKILPPPNEDKGEFRFGSLNSFSEENTGLDELRILLEKASNSNETYVYQRLTHGVILKNFVWDIRDTDITDETLLDILNTFHEQKLSGGEVILSGTIYMNEIGTQEKTKYKLAWPKLTINANKTIQDYTVRYVYIDKDGNEVPICDDLIIEENEPIPDIFIDEGSFSDAKELIAGVYANQDWSNWGKDGGNWGTYAPEGTKINKTEIERLLPKDPSNRFTYYIGHPDARNSALVDINSDGGTQEDGILYYESYSNYYVYLPYDGWKRKYANGAIVEIDPTQCMASGNPDESITMVVNTIPITNRFTVTWYLDETKQQSLHEETLVPYGTELSYDMDAKDKIQFIGSMGTHTIKTFKGWNLNTGCVAADLEVWGLWDIGEFSKLHDAKNNKIKPMKDMNPAEIYAIAVNNNAAYKDVKFNDYEAVNITLGQDFDFGNVEQEILVGPGGKIYDTNWIDDVDDPDNDCYKYYTINTVNNPVAPEEYKISLQNSFVFALDFKAITQIGTFLNLSVQKNEDTIDFFKLDATGSNVVYYNLGDISKQRAIVVGERERLVFLYDHFTKTVKIFISNDRDFARYNIIETKEYSIEDILPTVGEDGLVGDLIISFANTTDTQACIYDCKLWKENLGLENCRKLANWPRELIQVRYSSNTYVFNGKSGARYHYKDEEGNRVESHGYFVCDGVLSKKAPMNYTLWTENFFGEVTLQGHVASGGWKNTKLKALLNGGQIIYNRQPYQKPLEEHKEDGAARVYNAFPENWRAIIKETLVPYKQDGSETQYESSDYIFLPSMFEYIYDDTQVVQGSRSLQRDGYLLSWINNAEGTKQTDNYFFGKTKGSYRPKSRINEKPSYTQVTGSLNDFVITERNIGDIIQEKHDFDIGSWRAASRMIGFSDFRLKSKIIMSGWWTRTYATSGNIVGSPEPGFSTITSVLANGNSTPTYTPTGIVPCFTI